VRHTLAVDPARAREIAHSVSNARFLTDGAQGYWLPGGPGAAEFVFQLADPSGKALAGFTAGGRFLDLSGGQAPDKFTAEVRPVPRVPATDAAASIAWSSAPTGPFQTIWEFDPKLKWKDGRPIDRTLLWQEVDRGVAPSLQRVVYVRFRLWVMAVDAFRLGVETPAPGGSTPLEVRHVWKQQGATKDFTITIPALTKESRYVIDSPKGARITNEAIVFECKRGSE
jgi:hypothetical protein